MPFEIDNEERQANELRLKYRQLDLRLRGWNIDLRHKIAKAIREFLWPRFLE